MVGISSTRNGARMKNLLFRFLNYRQNKLLQKHLKLAIPELDDLKYDTALIAKAQAINNENKQILEHNLNMTQTISDLDLYTLKLKRLYGEAQK